MADKVRREKRVQEAATDAIREDGNVVPDEHARFRETRSVVLSRFTSTSFSEMMTWA